MTLRELRTTSISVITWLCLSATFAAASNCPHCQCSNGHCSCPDCNDSQHYPGFCDSVGCQNGFSCCPIFDCGGCYCSDCNPRFCATDTGCVINECVLAPLPVENIDANSHLQPWMIDQTLSSQLAAYSRSLSVAVAKFQQIMSDTTIPLASRRKLLQPSIAHLELAVPEHRQSVVIETKYNARKGAWLLRLVKGLKGEQSTADILTFMPQEWSLHNEASGDHIGNGRIAPMQNMRDLPKDDNVESQAAARLAKAQAAQAKAKQSSAIAGTVK